MRGAMWLIAFILPLIIRLNASDQCTIDVYSGHSAAVYGLSSLPSDGDGVRFLSASNDYSILQWKVGVMDYEGKYVGHTSGVICVAVLGGDRFISGGYDNKVIVWELGKYSPLKVIGPFHTDAVWAVLDLKDGTALSASDDKKIIRFNVLTGIKMVTFLEHTNYVKCLALLPDGTFISGSWDNKIKRWDKSSSTAIETYNFGTFVMTLRVLDSNSFLAAGGSATSSSMKKFKIGTLTAAFTFSPVHTKQINSISLLPDLSFVTGGVDGLVLRWVDGRKDPITNYPGSGAVWATANLTDGSLITGLGNTNIVRYKTNGNFVSLPFSLICDYPVDTADRTPSSLTK